MSGKQKYGWIPAAFPSQMAPPSFPSRIPLHFSIEEYDCLRSRIAREKHHFPLCDVNHYPFNSLSAMVQYFYKIASDRLKVAEIEDTSTVHRIRCPMMTIHRSTGKLIECLTTNSRPLDLERHLLLHMAEPPYKCCSCDHRAYQKSNLDQHIRTMHIKKQVECVYCGESFKDKADRSRHYRAVHDIVTHRARRGDAWMYMDKSGGRRTPSDAGQLRKANWGEGKTYHPYSAAYKDFPSIKCQGEAVPYAQ
ncbi:unnamed protein product [Somion occarium]